MTPWVYWLDYRQVIFVSLFKGRGKLIKLLELGSKVWNWADTGAGTVPIYTMNDSNIDSGIKADDVLLQ